MSKIELPGSYQKEYEAIQALCVTSVSKFSMCLFKTVCGVWSGPNIFVDATTISLLCTKAYSYAWWV